MRIVSSGKLRNDPLSAYQGKAVESRMLSEETKKDYWRMIKCFFRYLGMKEVLDIQKPHFRSYKRFDGIISEEHVLKAVEKTISVRDKALLWVLHETGARVGELLNMRIQDVERNGRGAKVLLDGKTGPRKVMVVKSVPYLFRWLEMHPLGYDRTMFIWLADRSTQVLGRTGVCQIIKRAFNRVGLGHLKLNPHYFRHSRATIMAPHLTEAMMCKYFGWRIGSKMPGVYVHVTQEDVDNVLCEMYGFEKPKGMIQENLPKNCPVCKGINGCDASFCSNCGSSFSVAEGMSADERYEQEMGKTMKLLEKVMENPMMMERFVEWRRGRNSESVNP
jgi:site-specific recombinase XerD